MTCTGCNKPFKSTRQEAWILNNYHGMRGTFCWSCYEKVKHDSYGQPAHPVAYRNVKKKLGIK